MADNRMYLRCKCCGKTLFLGKRFGNGYYINEYRDVPFIDRLNNFYDDHVYCRGQGQDCFEIEYEMKPEV
jgi:hypothetical protein